MDQTVADPQLLSKIQQLEDLDLAMLLCLMSSNHAIIQTEARALKILESKLLNIAGDTFGLTSTSFRCDGETTLSDFTSSLLIEKSSLLDSLDYSGNDGMCIPNIVVIRDLQLADQQVQIQALELIRTKSVFTKYSRQAAPKHFLLILISDTEAPPLLNHLRDYIFVSHIYEAADDQAQIHGDGVEKRGSRLVLTPHDVKQLSTLSDAVISTAEVTRYMHDVVIFLRMHRAIAAGTTPLATKHFAKMCRCLAVLHGIPYVTPSLVILAVKKVFCHRLVLVKAANERSLQYGSDFSAIVSLLDGLTVEIVIDEVIESLECPT